MAGNYWHPYILYHGISVPARLLILRTFSREHTFISDGMFIKIAICQVCQKKETIHNVSKWIGGLQRFLFMVTKTLNFPGACWLQGARLFHGERLFHSQSSQTDFFWGVLSWEIRRRWNLYFWQSKYKIVQARFSLSLLGVWRSWL